MISIKYRLHYVIYCISLLIALLLPEAWLQLSLNESQKLYLPYFGFSEDQNNLRIWKLQPDRDTVGTITHPYSFDIENSKLGWSVRPNSDVIHSKSNLWNVKVNTNSSGLRMQNNIEKHRSGGIPRIGFIGASQTFGESVNNNEDYVSLLNNSTDKFEALNFGVRGYGTDQMLLFYDNVARQYDLNVVVVAFAFHHIPRNVSSFTFYAKPRFKFVGSKLVLTGSPVPTPAELYDTRLPDINGNPLNYSLFARYILDTWNRIYQQQIYATNSKAWMVTRAIIEKFSEIARANNTVLVFINIEQEKYDSLEIALKEILVRHDVAYLNLGSILRASTQDVQLHNDTHWTVLGHQVAAKEIFRYLCREKKIIDC